jgi:hypothetical protein
MKSSLNTNGHTLKQLLSGARHHLQQAESHTANEEKVHVVGAGGTLTAAYEQLRIAAEYAEEHLLLQRAIRRFYKRLFLIRDKNQIKDSGEELIIELTHAGYIANDSVTTKSVQQMSQLTTSYYDAYMSLRSNRNLSNTDLEHWTLDVLAVQIEWLLYDPALTSAYVQFVHQYYLTDGQAVQLFTEKPADFETALYVALQRALLKADTATVRAGLLGRYQQSPDNLKQFVEVNKQIDQLFSSDTTEKLFRYIDRRGAPLRVLKHMIDSNDTLHESLTKPQEFLSKFETQVTNDYVTINTRINRGIVKSVIFLVITKFLVGIAIEVPYDYLVLGAVAVTPLLINLVFPPIYMILLRMTLMLPGQVNTDRLVAQTEQILYGAPQRELMRKKQTSFGVGYNIAYALVFVIVFGGIGWWLHAAFEFELLHLFIFFLFLSGASFLGFRLSRNIREVEAVDSDQNAITTVRDFLYMPFVVVGRYMSEKYAQVNIVALTLDMFIELPLKTILRLIRQWGAFISSKKDEL